METFNIHAGMFHYIGSWQAEKINEYEVFVEEWK